MDRDLTQRQAVAEARRRWRPGGFASRSAPPRQRLGYHRYVVPEGLPAPREWRCAVGVVLGRDCHLRGEGATFREALAAADARAAEAAAISPQQARALAMRLWGMGGFAQRTRMGQSGAKASLCTVGVSNGCRSEIKGEGTTYYEAFGDAMRHVGITPEAPDWRPSMAIPEDALALSAPAAPPGPAKRRR